MCILFLHYHPSSSNPAISSATGVGQCTCPYVLVAAVNRDELYNRPTQPLHFWQDQPDILAGRDVMRAELRERGTWLGVSRGGRFAVLTNYRCRISQLRPDAVTRGKLVSNYLAGDASPHDYCQAVLTQEQNYNGFSFLASHIRNDDSAVVFCSNRGGGGVNDLGPGNYGLSNALLDSPWRKVERGREKFRLLMEEEGSQSDKYCLTEHLMDILKDDTCLHPDPGRPETGLSDEALRYMSSVFVQPINLNGNPYGTRTSSVVLVERTGAVIFTERTLTVPVSPEHPDWTTTQHSFTITS